MPNSHFTILLNLNDMLRRIMGQSGQSPQRNAARSMEAADSLAGDKIATEKYPDRQLIVPLSL